MIEDPKKAFAVALEYMIGLRGRGTPTKISRKTGIRPNQISDIKRGIKYGSETTRRKIADYFGHSYDDFLQIGHNLIDTGNPRHVAHYNPGEGPGGPDGTIGADTTELLNLAREVLESKTTYASALGANVRAFHRAIETEQRWTELEGKYEALSSKMETLISENALLKKGVAGSMAGPAATPKEKSPRNKKVDENG